MGERSFPRFVDVETEAGPGWVICPGLSKIDRGKRARPVLPHLLYLTTGLTK